MRVLQRSAIGALALVVLAGSGAAVTAQTEAESATSVSVTGTLECLLPPEGDTTDVTTHTWEASDERLSGSVTYTGEWQIYPDAAEASCACGALHEDASGEPATYRIVNDGGSWLCTTAQTRMPQEGDPATLTTATFQGEGGYEGLSAMLVIDWSTAPFTFGGLIVPGDIPAYVPPEG